jgi:hypothetical protein
MRPTSFHVTEAIHVEDTGMLEFWVEADGTTYHFGVHPTAITHRKLVYGHAHIETTTDEDGNKVSVEVLDDVTDADGRALQDIIAEHFDRFEAHGLGPSDFHGFAPDAADVKRRNPHTRRQEFYGNHPLPKKAPQAKQPREVKK